MMKKILFLLSILIVIVGIGMINKDEQSTALAQMGPGGFSNVSPFIRDGDAIRLRSTIDYIGTYADPIPNIIVDYITASSTFITDAEFDYILVNEVATSTILRVGDGTAAIPSYSFEDDIDTGLYLSAADTLSVTVGGTERWDFAGNGISGQTSGSAWIVNVSSDATTPTLRPSNADDDTGIGYAGGLGLSLVEAGVEGMRVASTSVQVVDGTAAIPSYSFLSDTDTGFHLASAGNLRIDISGASKWQIGTTVFQSESSTGPRIDGSTPSAISPNIVPNREDLNTGLGWNSADELSLIAGGTEGLRIDYNELEVQPLMTLATGPIELEEDSGAVTVINLPVSSTPDDGDEESMTFAIDSNAVLKIKGSADGSGGANDFQVVVDPLGTFGSAALPSLAFGDGDSGIYEQADDVLSISIGGGAKVKIEGNIIGVQEATGAAMFNEIATATNPTLLPDKSDVNTGIGHAAADQLSLIAGGLEVGRFASTTITFDSGSNATTTLTIDDDDSGSGKGACLKLRDSDDAGWTYCSVLDGTMTCSTDSCE